MTDKSHVFSWPSDGHEETAPRRAYQRVTERLQGQAFEVLIVIKLLDSRVRLRALVAAERLDGVPVADQLRQWIDETAPGSRYDGEEDVQYEILEAPVRGGYEAGRHRWWHRW